MTEEQKKLVEDNLMLVRAVVSRDFKLNCSMGRYEEMVEIGNEALCRAAVLYDPNKGIEFSTYAWHAVVNSIRTHYKREQARWSISLDHLVVKPKLESDMEERFANRELIRAAIANVKKHRVNDDGKTINILNGILEGRKSRDIAQEYGYGIHSTAVVYSKMMKAIAREAQRLLKEDE